MMPLRYEILKDTPEVRAALRAIRKVYSFDAAGGNLHAVLDDGNMQGEINPYYVDEFPTGPEQMRAELRCAEVLNSMSEDHRMSAWYRWHNLHMKV